MLASELALELELELELAVEVAAEAATVTVSIAVAVASGHATAAPSCQNNGNNGVISKNKCLKCLRNSRRY